MLTLDELSQRIAAYKRERLSLGEFEEWFEDNSSGEAYDNPELRGVCAAVDAAFSEYHFGHIGEEAMRLELAAAIRPFDGSEIPVQEVSSSNRVVNNPDPAIHFPIFGSNSNTGLNAFNAAA